MGLYINPSHQHTIYKTNSNPMEPNQETFTKNHTVEMVQEQKRINELLNKSLTGLKVLYEQQKYEQVSKWIDLQKQLHDLQVTNEQHEVLEREVLEKLTALKTEHEKLTIRVGEGKLSEQEIQEKLNGIVSTQQGFNHKIEEFNKINTELKGKIEQQIDLQKQMTDKMITNEDNQKHIEKRLDNQEALTEKMTRQLDQFRSILYERTNDLAEKIEKVSTSVVNAITRDSLRSHFITQKKENTHK
jgi:DNA repair exonuclease SbcCD ATPase subunit